MIGRVDELVLVLLRLLLVVLGDSQTMKGVVVVVVAGPVAVGKRAPEPRVILTVLHAQHGLILFRSVRCFSVCAV